MAYIAGLVITGLFFLSLHYFTELKTSQKATVTSIVLSIILSAVAFNAYSTAQRESMMKAVIKFNQNKTIRCDGVDVNNSLYSISIGTYTFIGKENTPNYGQMISASTCE